MAKSQQSYNKKEKEKKRLKKKKDKAERREQRKLERIESGPKSFEDMLAYVDEDGNLTTEKPDPLKKRKVFKVEDIVLGVPTREKEAFDPVREGKVKFFNHEKGFGFIVDLATDESIFAHINNMIDEITEGDRVLFETEKGPKGLSAINVKLGKKEPKKVAPPEPKEDDETDAKGDPDAETNRASVENEEPSVESENNEDVENKDET